MVDYDAQNGRQPPAQPAGQAEADEVELYAGLRGVAGLVADAHGVSELLREVAEFAVQAIPGVDATGVALIDARHYGPAVQRSTADFVYEIEHVQYDELNEGPGVTCIQSRRATVSGSLGSDKRWPHFGGRVARMGVHSALSLPMIVGDEVIGAINSYANERDSFGEHAVRLGTQFAGPAAVSIYNAQLLSRARERTEQLQRALDSRAVIDQAIGIVRSRSGVDAQVAFDRLIRMSQAENVKLHVLAERMVEEAVRRAMARQRHP